LSVITRTSIKVVSDEQFAPLSELATKILKTKEKTEDLPQIESDIFDSGISVCYGAAEVVPAVSAGEVKVTIKKRDYLDVFWDCTAKDFNLSDALFTAVGETFTRESVERKYGKISNYGDPLFGHRFYRDAGGSLFTGGKETVRLVNHYAKEPIREYILLFNDYKRLTEHGEDVFIGKFAQRSAADAKLRELNSAYLAQDAPLPMGEIIPYDAEAITKYVVTGGEIVDVIELQLTGNPVAVFRPFQFENRFWSLADLLIEPQIFLDRVFMQIDYSFGRDVKNVYQGNLHALADSETPDSALRKAEKTGGIIWTRTGEEVFRPIKVSGVNPQYFQIAAIMQGFIEDLAGGRSFHGMAEYSNESGKAILAKQKQGMLAAGMVLDNLRRWKCSLGEKLLEATLHYEGESAVAMAAQQLDQEAFNGGRLPTAEEIALMDREIVVTDAPLSGDEKAEKLEQLISVNNIFPGAVPLEVMLDNMNLDREERDRIIFNYNNLKDQRDGNKIE